MGANIYSLWVRVHTLCLVVHKDGLLLLSFILPQGIILDGWYNWQYHETFFFPMAGPIRNLAFWMQCYNITKNEKKKKVPWQNAYSFGFFMNFSCIDLVGWFDSLQEYCTACKSRDHEKAWSMGGPPHTSWVRTMVAILVLF